jgi:hypothetical protein
MIIKDHADHHPPRKVVLALRFPEQKKTASKGLGNEWPVRNFRDLGSTGTQDKIVSKYWVYELRMGKWTLQQMGDHDSQMYIHGALWIYPLLVE